MSRASETGEALPETVVRNRGQYSNTLHRLDSEADEPQPAYPEGTRPDAEFIDVARNCYPTYNLCGNPECFGGEKQ